MSKNVISSHLNKFYLLLAVVLDVWDSESFAPEFKINAGHPFSLVVTR